MTPTDIAIPVGLLTLLTFLQTLVPSVLLWNTSKFDEGTTPTGKDGMGPRDRIPVATTTVARLERAKANLIESLVMFSPALAIALFAGAGSLMLIGIWLFVAARVLYVPSYVFGILYVRSACWTVGLVGISLVWWSALNA